MIRAFWGVNGQKMKFATWESVVTPYMVVQYRESRPKCTTICFLEIIPYKNLEILPKIRIGYDWIDGEPRSYVLGSKLLVLGMGDLQPLIGILIMGILTPTIGLMTVPYYMEIMGVDRPDRTYLFGSFGSG